MSAPVTPAAAPKAAVIEPDRPTEAELEKMTKAQLLNACEELGVDASDAMTKAEIIEEILTTY